MDIHFRSQRQRRERTSKTQVHGNLEDLPAEKDIMPPKAKTTKKDSASTNPKARNADQARPNWPPISPVLPAADLTLNTLLQDQILTIPQLWTASLCKNYVGFLATLPLTTTPGKPKRGEAVRVNDRFQVDDSEFAKRLWGSTALEEIVEAPVVDGVRLDQQQKKSLWGGEVLGLNSNIRIYRYSKGQYFDQHCEYLMPCNVSCDLADDLYRR